MTASLASTIAGAQDVRPMMGGNANVTISPSSDNVTVPGNSTETYQFYLGNNGTANTTASLYIQQCSGAVSNCSVSPRSVSLPYNGNGAVATVTYQSAATGTGTIVLYVGWPSGNSVTGTLTVTMRSAPPVVTVSPNPQYTAENFATNDPYFSIRNSGNTAATYTLVAQCSGNISGCSVASPTASVPAGSSVAAIVYYTSGPYYTLDTPRNVTLVYNGDRAFPRPFIYADVSVSSGTPVRNCTLEVKRLGADLPFVNGETKLTFQGTTTPATTYRLAGQVDMTSEPTRMDSVTVLVTVLYTNGQSDVASAKTQLLIVNATLNGQAAPVAKGWRFAGMQYFRGADQLDL